MVPTSLWLFAGSCSLAVARDRLGIAPDRCCSCSGRKYLCFISPEEELAADGGRAAALCLVRKSGPAFSGVLHRARRVLAAVELRIVVGTGIPGSVLCPKLGELRVMATACGAEGSSEGQCEGEDSGEQYEKEHAERGWDGPTRWLRAEHSGHWQLCASARSRWSRRSPAAAGRGCTQSPAP